MRGTFDPTRHYNHNGNAACGRGNANCVPGSLVLDTHPPSVTCFSCERTKAYKKADAGRQAQAAAKSAAVTLLTDAELDQAWNALTKARRGHGMTEAELTDLANASRRSRRNKLRYLNGHLRGD